MMKSFHSSRSRRDQRGASLIEVLVSLVILMIGLLGLVGLMIQSQRSQVESYQRVQALMLAQDMASRMNANRAVAPCYALGANYLGTGGIAVPAATACVVAGATTAQKDRVNQDMTEWQNLLLGSAERVGADTVGTVLSARGCVTVDGTGELFQVSVAWQGMAATGGPPAGVTCGQNLYDQGGVADGSRRAVSITVQLSDLS